jgi:hypothetical protein
LGAHVTGTFAMVQGKALLVCIAGGQGGLNGNGRRQLAAWRHGGCSLCGYKPMWARPMSGLVMAPCLGDKAEHLRYLKMLKALIVFQCLQCSQLFDGFNASLARACAVLQQPRLPALLEFSLALPKFQALLRWPLAAKWA